MEEIKQETPEVKVEHKDVPKAKGVDIKKFIARKMKDINNMSDKRKARFNAGQVLKNK